MNQRDTGFIPIKMIESIDIGSFFSPEFELPNTQKVTHKQTLYERRAIEIDKSCMDFPNAYLNIVISGLHFTI